MKHVKFPRAQELPDGSYLSWIHPDRKSKKKGASRIQVRVIEYLILEQGEEVVYRLITDLIDYELFPSLLLANEYHWRWEVENTLSEFKTHLNARKTPIRAKKPRLVVQEIYGWLIAHWAIRSLIFRASTKTSQSPLQFSFTGTLRILRRAISQFQQAFPSSLPYFFSWLISEITEQIIPPRQGRTNPRVVKKRTARAEVSSALGRSKKPRSKFKARKPIHRTGFTQLQTLTFAVTSSTT